ncbi:MAG: GTP-binding protein, partial [Oscillospiraceae bacterium]|nr:GTP-binding protein [Oscillospiraceae bacterium]
MDIRNICLLGHGGSGKTSLVESMLYITGVTDRLGKTADGNTVCDYDPEEVKRQISISLAMTPITYNGVKINVMDTPGNFDFAGEMQSGVRAAEVGVLVCASKDGLSVGAERCWKYLKEQKKPCIVYISKEDEENANFSTTLEALREKLSKSIAPIVAPIWDGNKRTVGLIDVLNRKAYQMPDGKKGKRVEIPIPEGKQKVLDELYGQLMEAVAETTEENMEKFFSGEPFTKEEIMTGLKVGMHEGTLAPVVCGSAFTGLGTEMLLGTIVDLVPAPGEMPSEIASDEAGENEIEVKRDPNGPTAAIVFKTISDQYGKYSLVKVVSGKITGDMSLYNPATGKTEKLGRLYTIKGKKNEEVKEIACGDIGAIAKMDRLKTGETLCDPKKVVKLAPVQFAEPCYSRAIAPKTRGQDEKVGTGLIRLNEEDPTFSVVNNAETHQVVVSGAGDIQIDVLVSKLKSRFGVDAELDTPRVAYREKIRKQVRKQGRHKKQTGGSGQFGDVHIVFEP